MRSFALFITLSLIIIGFSAFGIIQNRKINIIREQLWKLEEYQFFTLKIQGFVTEQKFLNYQNSKEFFELVHINKLMLRMIDSLSYEKLFRKKQVVRYLDKIKNSLIEYKNTTQSILEINNQIYAQNTGLESEIKTIENRIQNQPQFKKLNLLPYFIKLKSYRRDFFSGKISKEAFEKLGRNLLTDLDNKINGKQNYYYLIFQDYINEYFDNTLNEYAKFLSIGQNNSQGKLKRLYDISVNIREQLNDALDFLHKRNYTTYKFLIFYYIVIMIFVILVIYYTFHSLYYRLSKPWSDIEPKLIEFSKGKLIDFPSDINLAELSTISANLNELSANLKLKNTVLKELVKRNYAVEYEPAEDDEIGNTIVELKKGMLKAQEEAKIFGETEEHQKWAANGIAKIGAIMRQYTNDIDDLTKNVLQEVIKYVNASIGALYLYDEEKNVLKLNSFFSYGKQRIKQNEIRPYEGLLGTILIEKRSYYFEQVPKDYIFLETGMGYGRPKSLFAFPLLFENKIYGIIELAFLEEIEEYKRKFLLNLANEIAITISYTKINIQTKELLEQSEKQAEELQSNEKLYRKNQENLKSLLRMTEQRLNEREQDLKYKEEVLKNKVEEYLNLEKELSEKEEYIENLINEYENVKSILKNQNEELRRRIEELEKRLRDK